MRYMQVWDYLFKVTFFDEYGQRPATDDEIKKAGSALEQDLNRNGFTVPAIPDDYADFLKFTDGYEWNGFRLFGSKPFKCDVDYSISSIYERNIYYRENRSIPDNMLVIGGFDDDLFVYSGNDGRYHVLDDVTFIPIDSYPDFEQFLFDTLQSFYLETIEDDDELFDEFMSETGYDEIAENLPENDSEV